MALIDNAYAYDGENNLGNSAWEEARPIIRSKGSARLDLLD